MPTSREYPLAPIAGVAAVIIQNDCVLLVRRAQPPLMGEWAIPGGAVELGETIEEAIIREIGEETGLIVAPESILKTFDRIERDADGRVRFHYILTDFLCRLASNPQRLHAASDVSEARWVPLESLRRSEEFILPDWTLEVVEQGWQLWQASEHPARR